MAFDPFWSPPNSDGTGENIVYRFGSVGQVCKNICIVMDYHQYHG